MIFNFFPENWNKIPWNIVEWWSLNKKIGKGIGRYPSQFLVFFIFEKLKGSKGAVLIGMRIIGQVLNPILAWSENQWFST
jgi:hypothetical protein